MNKNKQRWTIGFQPEGRRIRLDAGESLLEAVRQLSLPEDQSLYAPCGGLGGCGRCRILITRGLVSPPTEAEERSLKKEDLERGCRLACQVTPRGDVDVEIPAGSRTGYQELQVEGMSVAVAPDPAIRRYGLELQPSSLKSHLSLWPQIERSLDEKYHLHNIRIDLDLVRRIAVPAEAASATVTLRGNEIINIHFSVGAPRPVGLAIDFGTTKVAGFLVDLESGATLTAEGIMNPQIPFGEDVISRLVYATQDEEHLSHLARAGGDGINRLLQDLLARTGLKPDDVEEVLIVGNTAMHHLLLRLPVRQLGRAPYMPAVTGPIEVKAKEIGLEIAPGAVAHFLPPVAGFVGSDHVAMILAARLHEAPDVVLGIDIGTNTEVVLARAGELMSCSCASGPAFEGAHIHQGMRAVEGAISRVQLTEGGRNVDYETIGSRPPVGICGSGVLDAVAELLRYRVINDRGVLEHGHPRVKEGGDGAGAHFLLAPAADSGLDHDLILTQKDISEIQLAKAAIASGIEILLRFAGVKREDVRQGVVAGAFGTHLSVKSAVAIGMLPDLPLDRFRQVGNIAGAGARMALVSLAERRLAEEIARRVRYVELAGNPEFPMTFARALRFPGNKG